MTPLHEAVAAWLATIDVLGDRDRAGPYACLRDGLPDLVPIAEAAEPGPLRDAVLALAEVYDDLAVLSAAGLSLSPQMRAGAVERVLLRFDAVARLVEEQRPPA